MNDDSIKIDKGVPIPIYGPSSMIAKAIYKLEIGDSFVAPQGTKATSIPQRGRYYKMKLAIRKQPDGTYRIWRKS